MMLMRLKDGKEKVLTLSYDDGAVHDEKLVEILNRYGIKGTFNLNSGNIPDKAPDSPRNSGNLSWEEVEQLYIPAGHEVAVHTLTHPWIADLSEEEILYEVLEDRKNLEAHTGTVVRGMAYPFGCFNDKTVDAIAKAGIVYSRTTIATKDFAFPDDWLRLSPTCHHYEPELMKLAERFLNDPIKWNRPQMFYLWGHSFEFARNNDWNVLEDFCRLVGGRDDVWYATNIEIYDYTAAYRSLQVSYDSHTVHNPSAITVWFHAFGATHKVDPGETISI